MRTLLISILFVVGASSRAGTNELFSDDYSWTGSVYLAIIGDSISGGGGGSGGGVLVLPTAISNASGNHFSITNSSVGGSRWTNMPGQLAVVLERNPRWVFVHCGRNDLLTCFITNQVFPCYWPTISSILDESASNCNRVGSKLLVGEVLPAYTNYTEWATPGIRLINSAYSNWCVTNIYSSITKMSIQHDAFAVTNTETSQLDWLNQIYHQSEADQLHLSPAAYTYWGPLIMNTLGTFYPLVPTLNVTTLNIGP